MKRLLLSTVLAILLFASSGFAHADEYAFTFTDDPVGCASIACMPVAAGGVFTTLPLPTDESYFGPTIGSLTGRFNGFAMSLVSTGTQVIPDGQAGSGAVMMENALMFSAGGQTYSLFWDDGPHPDGFRFDLRAGSS